MNTPIGYIRKRRQIKLMLWTDGASRYLQARLRNPLRHRETVFEPHTPQDPMSGLRHSSGFGKVARRSMHQSFTGQLMNYMRKKKRNAMLICRSTGISRSLLAEILSDQQYRPARELALLLAFALRLRLQEADKFLAHAGYALSHQQPQDIVLEYFLRARVYRIRHINEVLRRLELPLLIYKENDVWQNAEQTL